MLARSGWVLATAAGVAIGYQAGQAPNPQERTLDANLYMQTSAEYRAVCVQTYNWAAERLTQKLANLDDSTKPPAVVMDLDETVIDNASFQSYIDREKMTYSDVVWEKYESGYPSEVKLIPGAKSFIDRAEALGVTVIYLSNRVAKHREATIKALTHVGLSTEGIDQRLLLKDDTSNKTVRRAKAAESHRVIMLVGDNLRDFSEEFTTPARDFKDPVNGEIAMKQRWEAVDRNAWRFGTDYIVLPNPVYGEWQKLLGTNPRGMLRPSGIK
ncbi:MAG: hypothetical protein IT363_09495 [Methanoregulaceae archaeon]|nr:hypothetical protein [Methanoregulaceae archaeon]